MRQILSLPNYNTPCLNTFCCAKCIITLRIILLSKSVAQQCGRFCLCQMYNKRSCRRHDLLLLFRFYAFGFSPSRVRIFTVIFSVSTHTNIIFFILFKLFHGQLGCFYFFNFNFFCFFEFFIC